MSSEEYSPSLFDSVRALVVLVYILVWVAGMVVQFLMIRGFKRHGIQEFMVPFYRWGLPESRRLRGFLYQREYERRTDIPPDLARRCAQMRWLYLAMYGLLALLAAMVMLPSLWRILHK